MHNNIDDNDEILTMIIMMAAKSEKVEVVHYFATGIVLIFFNHHSFFGLILIVTVIRILSWFATIFCIATMNIIDIAICLNVAIIYDFIFSLKLMVWAWG